MPRLRSIACLLAIPLVALSQNFSGGFSFFLPPSDTAANRFLPSYPRSPLTDQDFVSVGPDGHFTVRGAAIRFFGANFVADGAFPTPASDWFIAGRFRKMGFNLVRFHHMDNPWTVGSLFVQGQSTRQLSVVTLDRLDHILAELKNNGIYADINLHVGRTFNALDGIPDADSLQDYGKGINFFDPAVLALHEEFARQLLTHKNPYSSVTLAADPVMAMVEITNENSLYRYWRDGRLKHFDQGGILTARHTRMLDSLWCAFLKARYGSSVALATLWNQGTDSTGGPNMLVNGTFEAAPPSTGWVMEVHQPAMATMLHDSVNPRTGSWCARIDVPTADGTAWHLQWKQIGLSIVKDSVYLITFSARSDSTRPVDVALMNDVSPWTWYGGTSVTLSTAWQIFTVSFRAPVTLAGTFRLSFSVGGESGTYWFDDLSMTFAPIHGLLADETLEGGTVRRVDYSACAMFSDGRVRDLSSFYIGLQDDYFSAMTHFLKDSLGVRVPIVGTNWNVGPADMAVQSKLDYIDNHAYWDHPQFPGIPWSATDWLINNTPMVQAVDGGTIGGLMAAIPTSGKPFTISEYNHPFPNRYQSEAPLFLTAYSAFHGADGIMFFDYNGSVDWTTDKVSDYFSIHRNSAMMALMPSCASAFRRGLISGARTTYVINYAPDDYLTLPRRDNSGWVGPSPVDRRLALVHGVRTGSFASAVPFDSSSIPFSPSNLYVTDTKEITWNLLGVLWVATGRFAGLTGVLNTALHLAVGPLRMDAANGFGTITWVSLSSDSLIHAPLTLLTVSSKAQNTGMVWDGTTTIHDQWGAAPTQVAPLTLSLTLNIRADSIRVYPLDPWGRDNLGSVVHAPVSANMYSIAIDQTKTASMWFGIEKFGNGVTDVPSDRNGQIPLEFRLDQCYPNPFNPTTRIRFSVPTRGPVTLKLFDVLGREIGTLANEEMAPGVYERVLVGTDIPSGVYFYQLRAAGITQARRAVLVK